MPTPRPIIVASVGATVGTVATWPSMRMIASVASSARIALRIGSSIDTTVPNVSVRMTIAAMIPISSLDSVAGFETFWPSWPPVCTSSPAAFAGSAPSMILCTSSVDSSPGLVDSVTAMYPVVLSLLSAAAPCGVNGLTTEATFGSFATAAAAAFTASAFFASVSAPPPGSACRTIGLVPLAWSGNDLASASVAAWLSVPGSERLSLVLSPRRCDSATSAIVATSHTATTAYLRRTLNCARRCSTPVIGASYAATFSNTAAIPCPPPMHIVSRP